MAAVSQALSTAGRRGKQSHYDGQFAHEYRHGTGIFRKKDGTVYDGDWVKGMMHGVGSLTKPNGDKYEGEFDAGYKNGDGMVTYHDGNSFVGTWEKGRRCGKGTFMLKARDKGKRTGADGLLDDLVLPDVLNMKVFGY